MKRLVLILFFILNFHIALYADIDERIKAIQHAPASERYKLMNAFKRELVQMKEEERISALKKLSRINQSKHARSVLKELSKRTHRTYGKRHRYEHRNAKEDVADKEEHNQNIEDTDRGTEEHSSETEENVENNTGDHTEESIQDHTDNQTQTDIEDQTDDQTQNSIDNQTEEHVEQENTENEIEEHTEHETEENNEEEHEDD